MMEVFTQVTAFLASIVGWIALIGFICVLRRLGRVERALLTSQLLWVMKESKAVQALLEKKLKDKEGGHEAYHRGRPRDRRPWTSGGTDKAEAH